MDKIARGSEIDRKELFSRTADAMGQLSPAIIEKDFWVCWVLDALFSSPQWLDKMIFKGGTSLSKAFHIISRFSEDIDLILDWRQLGVTSDEAWDKRSNSSQEKFCKDINSKAAAYLASEFVPLFSKELDKKLGQRIPVNANGEEVTITYPRTFSLDYLRPEIVLEIGPLAEWVPHAPFEITPYSAEKFPDLFAKKSALVVTILAERTFWEKATILHKLASQGKIPPRHSRHYYDLARLSQSETKNIALGELDLLHEVISFKQRFYRSTKAQYEKAVPGSFRLLPDANLIDILKKDYNRTKEMIFGTPPTFESIIQTLKALEDEINSLSKE
jgi:Nucleotidyl transferase AbiEii toxin, Type IV TA system